MSANRGQEGWLDEVATRSVAHDRLEQLVAELLLGVRWRLFAWSPAAGRVVQCIRPGGGPAALLPPERPGILANVRKYFTRRCIGLHVTALILIPAFLVAAWWQYGAARSGNDLSWAYVFEWPFFAVYAAYIWWKLIHDQHTPLDRLWAAKARIAADAVGTPINQIPGWALDKDLTQSVIEASAAAVKALEMTPGARTTALGAPGRRQANVLVKDSESGTESGISDGCGLSTLDPNGIDQAPLDDPGRLVIDVPVVEVRAVRDEELDAYNRYLADLSWRDPPKRWNSRRG